MWELYNEPGRGNGENGDMGTTKVKTKIGDKSNQLVYDAWVWARSINPSQPITATSAGSLGENNIKINRLNSDIHSIHTYSNSEGLRKKILDYQSDCRPVIVTEWLARTNGSTVEDCLPVMKEMNVGAVNWGFVSGKSATIWPWSSRQHKNGNRSLTHERKIGNVVKPGEAFPEPELWFHDLFRMDGTPYSENEIATFKKLTNKE